MAIGPDLVVTDKTVQASLFEQHRYILLKVENQMLLVRLL